MTGGVLIAIGEVTAPHGRMGEVRVLPLTDFPDRFSRTKRVFARRTDDTIELEIETAREHRGFVLVKFVGIDSITEAEPLRKALLEIPSTEVTPLPEGRYYLFQIVGLIVTDREGLRLGKVRDILFTGGNDVYVVTPEPGVSRKEILVPAIKDVVDEIDVPNGRMVINLLPGLIEEDSDED